MHTQVPYCSDSLPFCRPHRVLHAAENLGEVLYGSVIENAPFVLRFGKTDLKVLCRVEMGAEERKVWTQRIREEYRGHLLLDNLPVATYAGADAQLEAAASLLLERIAAQPVDEPRAPPYPRKPWAVAHGVR